MLRTLPLSLLTPPPVASVGDATEEEPLLLPLCSVEELRPMEALLTRRIPPPEPCFRSGRPSCPVVKLVELRSFLELDLLRFPVEADAVWSRESESRFLTRVVSESRLALGCGELLTMVDAEGGGLATGEPFDETGIEELLLFSSDVSRRVQLCADSGRFMLVSRGTRFPLVIELGPVDRMYKLPVLLFNDLFDSEPDGDGELLSCLPCELAAEFATKFLPVGGFGAT